MKTIGATKRWPLNGLVLLPRLTLTGRLLATMGMHFAKRRPLGAAGAVILLVMITMAIFAPWVATENPIKTHYSSADDQTFAPPGSRFLLGTDNFGRDQYSRLVWGARHSFLIAFSAAFLGITTGALLGLFSGYIGGVVSMLVERVLDGVLAFPLLVIAAVIVAMLGPGTVNVILAISFLLVPIAAKVQRAATLTTKESLYVLAAEAVGCSKPRILIRHIFANTLSPYLILLTALFGLVIITESTLSFLGLGIQPPNPSWGLMLSVEGRTYFQEAWWLAVFPGVVIVLAVFSFNLLGDAIRDLLDPRLRT